MTGSERDEQNILVTAGRPERLPSLVNMPIELGSTVVFSTMADFRAAYANRLTNDGPIYYGRYGTDASRKLESALCEIEGAYGVTLTSSGVSAISFTLQNFARIGGHILVADNVYGNTRSFCETMLALQGVTVEFFAPLDLNDLYTKLRPETAAVMFEAPGSATFEVPDIRAIAEMCRTAGVPTILDSTWASPIFVKGFTLGVDVVVYSGSKYLCGHSDAMIGVIASTQKCHGPIRQIVMAYGDKPGAQEVFLALRGLRTLRMRLESVDKTARAVAKWLSQHPKVAKVLHPALPGSPGHEFWKRDFIGAAGLFSFCLQPCRQAEVDHFVDRLARFGIGVSWGGYESMALPMVPKRTVTEWDAQTPLVRLAIGFETSESLIEDLRLSLEDLSLLATD